MKIKPYDVLYYVLFLFLIHIEFNCLKPVSDSAYEAYGSLNYSAIFWGFSVALLIGITSIDPVHQIFKFIKLEKEDDISISILISLWIGALLLFRNLLLVLTISELNLISTFFGIPFFVAIWQFSKKIIAKKSDIVGKSQKEDRKENH